TVTNCGSPPVSDFAEDTTVVCVGGCVQFTDISTNSPTAWSWTINPTTGVTPATSTLQNPSICFNTAGTYDVTLQASNSIGAGTTKIKAAHITVNKCLSPPVADFNYQKDICKDSCVLYTDKSTSDT